MDIGRIFRHLIAEGGARRHFPNSVLDAIQQAVALGEKHHRSQVCFVVESSLPLGALWRGRTPRERAHDAFARLRVWNTEHNSGVLLFVLLADRAIEIVADRGVAARVAQGEWQAICDRMRERFAAGAYEAGAVEGVSAVSAILAREFPDDGSARANEISDRPVML